MARFCGHCGKPLADGEVCTCTGQAAGVTGRPSSPSVAQQATGFFERIKNHMGIGDPELNKGDAYEMNKLIIPDCVKADEGEVPVKQYEVASLQSRILGIPYIKAVGRMQVTNKRVIFRAPGRCLAGRTTLQHEFAIDELAGIEARREYVFNFMDLIIGVLAFLVGGGFITGFMSWFGSLFDMNTEGTMVYTLLFTLLFGVAGCVPFALLKEKWLLKILCLGGSYLPLLINSKILSSFGEYMENEGIIYQMFGGLFSLMGWVSLICGIFCLFLHVIKPNLVLCVKTKSASDAIDIKRKKGMSLFGGKDEEHTGYDEVIPAKDTEVCIREINAMITDIQKLGDFGIGKWKA